MVQSHLEAGRLTAPACNCTEALNAEEAGELKQSEAFLARYAISGLQALYPSSKNPVESGVPL